ncbi:septum site-determining protein MinC [Herminiimonas fonticola]|uniref:Probable septum site-determining protein MinC n=1 Tax=Herminiimonas fonticola TaxID=303380 RepID=A0A4R6GIG4_9BURK|nr:septum site-determining protein MinC [Herminiimonas fonticola]RBA25524.1 minC: septum site-determining protein MinC [Herminiimonas fonticola]TDN94637.1 septum site-determining protein MinC [Herminiimonas fonticola]
MSKRPSRKPIEIKISTVVAVSAILNESNLGLLDAAMQEMTGGNIDFFEDEFTVIDVGSLNVAHQTIDWHAITTLLKTYRLNAVAVRNAAPEMEADILAHGLSLDGPVKARVAVAAATPEQAEIELEPTEEIAVAVAPPAQAAAATSPTATQFAANTMIVDTPVRAGQRIYARGADLIITAAVNNGAEVIADGSIHIYAPLRGRALAGASGNTEARIFTLSMEAELVSIAGMYRTFEDGFPPELKQQATQIRLIGDRIDMLPIKSAA